MEESTHLLGNWLDHMWVRLGTVELDTNLQLYSPYYTCTDHDGLLTTLYSSRKEEEAHQRERKKQREGEKRQNKR